jgi:hypothetical protein
MPTPVKGTTLLTRYSTANGQPGTNVLKQGELAYSFLAHTDSGLGAGGDKLYIGFGTPNVDPVVIGGKYFTDMMDHVRGTLTADSAILVDVNSWVTNIKTGGLQLGTTGNSNQTVTAIITSGLNYQSSQTELPTARAVFDAITDGSNIFLDNLGDVQINGSGLGDAQVLIYDNGAEQWKNQTIFGDATIDNQGEITLDPTVLGTAAGEYGNAGAIPVITVNEKGLVTAIHTVSVSTQIEINGDFASTANLDILNKSLDFIGGDGIDATIGMDSNGNVTVSVAIDNTVATDADKLDFFSATSSAELAGVITDETGYSIDNGGALLVFNNSPTINDAIVAGTAQIDLFNDTATSVSAFGAATSISIGAATGDTVVNHNLIVAGNLTVNGSTTQVNTTVTTLTDPVMELATNAIAGGDANDRGIAFYYGQGGVVKEGFFGMDMQSKRFVFQTETGTSGTSGSGVDEFTTPWGDAEFNGLYVVVSEVGNIKLGGDGTLNTITTTSGDLIVNSDTGEVVFGISNGSAGWAATTNVTVSGNLTVDGTLTLSTTPLEVTSGGTGLDALTGNAFVITTEGSTGVAPAFDFVTYTSVDGSVGILQINAEGHPEVSDTIDGGTY